MIGIQDQIWYWYETETQKLNADTDQSPVHEYCDCRPGRSRVFQNQYKILFWNGFNWIEKEKNSWKKDAKSVVAAQYNVTPGQL